jgi:hypothetical protein
MEGLIKIIQQPNKLIEKILMKYKAKLFLMHIIPFLNSNPLMKFKIYI